ISEKFGMFDPCFLVPKGVKKPSEKEFLTYYRDYDILERGFINYLGVLEVPSPDSGLHFTRYISPLRNSDELNDMENYPIDDFVSADYSHFEKEVQTAHSKGKTVTCWVGQMYESAWQIRGYEEYLMDMLTAPENCECLMERLCENCTKIAVEAAKAGADYIRTGDDVANQRTLMFNIDTWRKFQKKYWKRVYDAAKEVNPNIQIWYHSDGNIWDIIPELIEIGVTILNPIQPECLDVEKVKKEFGKDIVLDGCIGTQTVMPFGSPSQVREAVKKAKDLCSDGGLILSPTHVLEPEVPIENIMAFIEESMI
ncbi:MAG: hypothetical protein KBT47_03450, partial [Armatimonadetes bacterium]|nr:hypothetical protein [Candidatus Hippobium faecium]